MIIWHPPPWTRLHQELIESVEKQLHTLPQASGAEGSSTLEDVVTRNLQEQVQLSEQVRTYTYRFGLLCTWHWPASKKDILHTAMLLCLGAPAGLRAVAGSSPGAGPPSADPPEEHLWRKDPRRSETEAQGAVMPRKKHPSLHSNACPVQEHKPSTTRGSPYDRN